MKDRAGGARRPLTPRRLRRIRAAILDAVGSRVPDWVDPDDSDPGVTLLQLFAFLTEELIFRSNEIPPRGASAARRLAQAARALSGSRAPSAQGGLRRVNYFAGQLLGESDFRAEQDYFRERLRRRIRFLWGSGVVAGLAVSVGPDGGGTGQAVAVEPGFALDPGGEEIEVCRRTSLPLPPPSGALLVQLAFAETLVAPVPDFPPSGETTEDGGQRFSRVEETFAVVLEPAPRPEAVPLARVIASRGRWRLDRAFKPKRVGPAA